MKRLLPNLVWCALILVGTCSCSYVGLYSKPQLVRSTRQAQERGFAHGRAHEIRRAAHQRKIDSEQPEPQPKKVQYSVPVPEHRNSDGVIIEAHEVPVEITQP